MGIDWNAVFRDRCERDSQRARSPSVSSAVLRFFWVYDALIARFEDATEPALRLPVAKALVNKGATLDQLNRSEEEIAVYDALIARFEDATEPALRLPVAKALVNKGATLGRLNRSEEEIAVYDALIARFEDATEPALREQVAGALVNMAAYPRCARRGVRRAGDSSQTVAEPTLLSCLENRADNRARFGAEHPCNRSADEGVRGDRRLPESLSPDDFEQRRVVVEGAAAT
jgi:tetratricopeptide (TPR) repeat protein